MGDARNKVNSLEFPLVDTNTAYYIPIECLTLEKGGQSPFGNGAWKDAYVVVTLSSNGSHYEYYWTSVDASGVGVLLTKEGDLEKEKVDVNFKDVIKTEPVGSKTLMVELSKDTCMLEPAVALNTPGEGDDE
jgi:hypothetical protein